MLVNEDTLNRANTAPRIGQARFHSLCEAIGGTAIGFAISLVLQSAVIVPLFHLRTNKGEDFLIVLIFTVVSILRSYGVRRFFNWLHLTQHQ